jgi:phage anti-repressor protein
MRLIKKIKKKVTVSNSETELCQVNNMLFYLTLNNTKEIKYFTVSEKIPSKLYVTVYITVTESLREKYLTTTMYL